MQQFNSHTVPLWHHCVRVSPVVLITFPCIFFALWSCYLHPSWRCIHNLTTLCSCSWPSDFVRDRILSISKSDPSRNFVHSRIATQATVLHWDFLSQIHLAHDSVEICELHMHPMVHDVDEWVRVVWCTRVMRYMWVVHCTTRAGSRVRDTCELFVTAVARVCARYSGVLHVCMYTMLDTTTLHFFEYRIELHSVPWYLVWLSMMSLL